MDSTLLFTGCLLLLALYSLKHFLFPKSRPRNLPPGPATALPIVGHLHLLKHPLHRTLQDFTKKCGSVFSLKFGSHHVVVISSSSAAEECLTHNDVVLANRQPTLVDEHIGYSGTTMIGSPYGDHWRSLRRLASDHIFSQARLKAFHSARQDELKHLLQTLYASSSGKGFAVAEFKSKFIELSFNVLMGMIAGKRFSGDDRDSGVKHFRDLLNELLEITASGSNPEDFFPFLRWFDIRGLKKKLLNLGQRFDVFFQGLVDEHRREKRDTMIGHLLTLQESDPDYYTDEIIKGLIMVLITAGTDTTASTMEWGLSVLLNHPDKLKRAREEVDSLVGNERLVDEADLPKLNYTQCIISETYRLFPAVPLLLPHHASADCTVQGYDIPRGTTVLFNAWAIHRDTNWEDPTSFKPERFEGNKEFNQFMFLPFGKGRRACPGVGLGQRVVGLALASLIQCFEWERITQEEVDLAEGEGLTLAKAKPLEAICRPRDFVHKLLST